MLVRGEQEEEAAIVLRTERRLERRAAEREIASGAVLSFAPRDDPASKRPDFIALLL